MQNLNNTLLNKQWVKDEMKRENNKYLKTSKSGNTTMEIPKIQQNQS